MASTLKDFVKLQRDSLSRNIETRVLCFSGLFLSYVFFFRLGSSDKVAAWSLFSYMLLCVLVLVISSWLDHFPLRIKELRLRLHKGSGLSLGCLLVPMVVTSLMVCSSYRAPGQQGLLSLYVILSCSMSLASVLATLFHMFPNPTNVSMYLFAVGGLAFGFGYTWNVTVPNVKPPAVLFTNIVIICLLYIVIVSWLLNAFEGSFSLGEACTLGQGISLIMYDIGLQLLDSYGLTPVRLRVSRGELLTALEVAVSAFIICFFLLYPLYQKVTQNRSDPPAFRFWSGTIQIAVAILIAFVFLPLFGSLIARRPLEWLLKSLFGQQKVTLLLYWTLLVVMAMILVIAQGSTSPWLAPLKSSRPSSSAFRKYFHVLGILIFVPGIAIDPNMTNLASVMAAILFITLEFIRYLDLWPLGRVIQKYLQVFVDEKEGGPLILSHIYLLIGLALPVWLYPLKGFSKGLPRISMYAGVMATGLGDMLASVVGQAYGRHHIKSTGKSFEGILASVIGQGLFIVILPFLDPQVSLYLYSPYDYVCLAGAIIATALMEGFTSQIDNLILSPFQFSLLLVSYT